MNLQIFRAPNSKRNPTAETPAGHGQAGKRVTSLESNDAGKLEYIAAACNTLELGALNCIHPTTWTLLCCIRQVDHRAKVLSSRWRVRWLCPSCIPTTINYEASSSLMHYNRYNTALHLCACHTTTAAIQSHLEKCVICENRTQLGP